MNFSFMLNVRNLPLSDGLFLHNIMKAGTLEVGYQRYQLSVGTKIDETNMWKERAGKLTCLNLSTKQSEEEKYISSENVNYNQIHVLDSYHSQGPKAREKFLI